jgi:translocator protein
MNVSVNDIIYLLLPSIIGYSTTALCKMDKKSGDIVKFRPPPIAFGIIWPILFVLFGLSWAIAMRESKNKTLCLITYILAVSTLSLWIYVYSCKNSKKSASWVLILTMATALMCFAQGNEISRVLICPLIAWAIFATIMNTTEVQLQP